MITIVSGLPRSGTSLMMMMLKAGGMEVMTDNIRKADEDNPKGYLEFEKVKKIKEDSSWLSGVEGKVFKMVSMLLFHLPPERKYKIIFMTRKMSEILASQKKMLVRQGKSTATDDDKMAMIFSSHLVEIEQWLENQDNIDVLYINYNDVLENPLEYARSVNNFLDGHLEVEEMIKVVDKSLYRQRG